jgi:hypothetical protein
MNSVKISLLDNQLDVDPACDKIVRNSNEVSYPYYRADSYMGSFYISEPDSIIFSYQRKVLPKETMNNFRPDLMTQTVSVILTLIRVSFSSIISCICLHRGISSLSFSGIVSALPWKKDLSRCGIITRCLPSSEHMPATSKSIRLVGGISAPAILKRDIVFFGISQTELPLAYYPYAVPSRHIAEHYRLVSGILTFETGVEFV